MLFANKANRALDASLERCRRLDIEDNLRYDTLMAGWQSASATSEMSPAREKDLDRMARQIVKMRRDITERCLQQSWPRLVVPLRTRIVYFLRSLLRKDSDAR